MNMLQIQDALRNASDVQLATEMQNPSGMAPQFLVLSELKRRRDMRSSAQQRQAPQDTLADELLAQDDGGIRDIVAPDEPEAQVEEMASGGLAALRMAAGGPVHYEVGGSVNRFEGLTDDDLRALAAARQTPIPNSAPSFPRWITGGRRPDAENPVTPDPNFYQRGQSRVFGVPPAYSAAQQADPADIQAELDRREAAARAAAQQAQPQGQQQAAGGTEVVPPSTEQFGPAIPPGSLDPRRAAAGRTASGIPGAVAASRSQPGAAPAQPSPGDDRLQRLFDRMEQERTNPESRRSEAMNMALIEAGLRIAGSQSPHLAVALGEGAVPAVQGYARERGQIREDQRAERREQVQGVMAENQQQYYRGRVQNDRDRMAQELQIAEMRERGANARAAAAGGRSSPTAVAEWILAGRTPEEREQRAAAAGRTGGESIEQRREQALANNIRAELEPYLRQSFLNPQQQQRVATLQRQLDAIRRGYGSFEEREGQPMLYRPRGAQ